ncbi:NAD(P)H-dependent oxidoreductase [Helicobacter sp. 13S00477-4]|uniref:NAD(P)H-dependent oxidoreductase n=1 Tax=Helicobacter sp. 13S00477-4 TaxID=1905759 RepID=UPI000BA7B089|nr:NAD(P)H-dependent oxidoreductase [Helicobacter sp. 13S00477-4]PAF50452.1 hypothetical protein BKH44_08270 [Helicobacter sp. 13S00477-4]
MKTLIILAHPNLKDSKINKTLIQSIKGVSNITLNDIYSTYPDGKINLTKEIELLKNSKHIIFQFPLYWFSTPSLLKEYQDVVFSGILYSNEPKILSEKTFQIITSAGSPEEKYSLDGRNQKSLEDILLPISMSAKYLGMQTKDILCIFNAMGMTDELLKQAINKYQKALGI